MYMHDMGYRFCILFFDCILERTVIIVWYFVSILLLMEPSW